MSSYADVDPTLVTHDATPVTSNQITITDGRAVYGKIMVIAHSDNSNRASWDFGFLAYRQGNSVTIVNQLLGLITSKTIGAALWDVYLDTSQTEILIKVKGANNVDINWFTEFNAFALTAAG